MERITSIQTIEHADGSSHEQLYCFGHLWGPAYFKKGNKDYEEYIAIVKRLAEYEDLEEQGKLLKLPCAVGDTVWYWDKENDPIEEAPFEGNVSGYEIVSAKTIYITINPKSNFHSWLPCDVKLEIEDFGKNIFLTREEAEAALKELGKDKG